MFVTDPSLTVMGQKGPVVQDYWIKSVSVAENKAVPHGAHLEPGTETAKCAVYVWGCRDLCFCFNGSLK